MTAPAAATPAATKLAAWKPWKKAALAVSRTLAASAGWPLRASRSAASSAAPIEPCAAPVTRLAYSDA